MDDVILVSALICGFTTDWSWDHELYAYRVFRMDNPGSPHLLKQKMRWESSPSPSSSSPSSQAERLLRLPGCSRSIRWRLDPTLPWSPSPSPLPRPRSSPFRPLTPWPQQLRQCLSLPYSFSNLTAPSASTSNARDTAPDFAPGLQFVLHVAILGSSAVAMSSNPGRAASILRFFSIDWDTDKTTHQ
jgi:hypothetical protein